MDWVTEGLVARGMPEHVARAFSINGMDESGLDTNINEISPLVPGSRGGFGLMQWTGPRRRALEGFAAERGMPAGDPNLQLDFLMYELGGPEASAWSKISAAQDTPNAAAAIVNSFLRPAEEHRARREANYLGGQYAMPTAGAPANALGGGQMPSPAPQNQLGGQQPQPQRPMANLLDPRAFMNTTRFEYTPIYRG